MSVKERRKDSGATQHQVKKSPASSSAKRGVTEESKEDLDSSDEEDDVLARTSLDLSNHPMPPLDALAKTIAQFSKLQKLDISSMKSSPDNEKGLSSLQWLGRATRKGKERALDEQTFGDNLTWLKMTDNPALGQQGGMEAWSGVECLPSLAVLNASSCALTTAPPASALLKLSSLAALVLAHNSITAFASIPHLPNLNTLVLSHNKISKLPKDLAANLPSLKKLSITQNALHWKDDESPLPDFTLCSHLREVRLSGNSRLGKLPKHLSTWGRGEGRGRKGTGLETLELADCALKDWAAVNPLMKIAASDEPPQKRRDLGNLSLKGNAVTSLSAYRVKILEAHPTLRTLDGEKLAKRVIDKSDGGSKDGEGRIEAPLDSNQTSKVGKDRSRSEAVLTKDIDEEKFANAKTARLQKERVRGKRGGRRMKDDTNGNGEESPPKEQQKNKLQERPSEPAKKQESKTDSKKTPALLDERLARRAGPPPLDPAAKQKAKAIRKQTEEAPSIELAKRPTKKRKAWDEASDERKEHDNKRAAQTAPPQQKEKDKERAQTSVAAVIQLNKKQNVASTVQKPVWGHLGVADANLGVGGNAWD